MSSSLSESNSITSESNTNSKSEIESKVRLQASSCQNQEVYLTQKNLSQFLILNQHRYTFFSIDLPTTT